MKSWNYLYSYSKDGTKTTHVELYEQPAWRELLGPLVYWLDKHVPRWMQPGEGRPTTIDHGDGTCTFLWRLRLDLYLGYDFHHDRRKSIETVRVDETTIRPKKNRA